jgi:hypothetical protein
VTTTAPTGPDSDVPVRHERRPHHHRQRRDVAHLVEDLGLHREAVTVPHPDLDPALFDESSQASSFLSGSMKAWDCAASEAHQFMKRN